MQEIAGMRVGVKRFRAIFAPGEPVVLSFGAAQKTRLYALPASKWRERIIAVYSDRGRRLDVDHRSLKEDVVVDILTNQVDADLRPWTYGFLSVSGTPGAYLVPASPFWRERVEGVGE